MKDHRFKEASFCRKSFHLPFFSAYFIKDKHNQCYPGTEQRSMLSCGWGNPVLMIKQSFTVNFLRPLSICVVLAGVIGGCGTKSDSVAASSEKSAAPVAAASSQDATQKFLTELEAQPIEKRKSFVEGHQAEAALVAQSHDPQVTEKFYNLMMPKMAMPQNR